MNRDGDEVTDYVCGMCLERSGAFAVVEFEGREYYFCSEACRRQFVRYPTYYADAAGASGASSDPVS